MADPRPALTREHRCVRKRIWTVAELETAGTHITMLGELCRRGDLYRVLPGIYCTRAPTTMDKCRAVVVWRSDAVLSHGTAAWLHGMLAEPSVIEAYVRELPAEPTPPWLRLRVPDYEIYDA